ncbi:YceI family protein [Flaviaesturariibacter flavus]|uniref:YceI family protein n=1 Tax=Flaviaesturariibacter flavus TaxID=2502780 RepID=A0A4R1B9K5_9BACT|nr:YceI family protein [Flaviaesturariibacter flavus]TCJ13589.1 YceI family protein [Flaviaesturariibacter flavus]
MIRTLLLPLLLGLLAASCSDNQPKGDNATITDKQATAAATGTVFTIDTAASRIRFTGHGVGKNHPGIFRLSSGTVALNGNTVSGGNFVINIHSMELEQKGSMFEDKLRPHLMSGDFFDANKFGSARFEITKVAPYQPGSKDTSIVQGANYSVSGNLTLKDVTKNITFPARIDLDGNTLKAKSNFDIDRRQWKMNYGNDKTLGDKFISETVNIELDLQARKQ